MFTIIRQLKLLWMRPSRTDRRDSPVYGSSLAVEPSGTILFPE
jgi:hypothetical protein